MNSPYDLCYDDVGEDPFNPKDELIYGCTEYVRDIVQALYSNGPLDRCELEEHLEGICKLLNIRIPENFLNIERRKTIPMRDYFLNLEVNSLFVTKKTI